MPDTPETLEEFLARKETETEDLHQYLIPNPESTMAGIRDARIARDSQAQEGPPCE